MGRQIFLRYNLAKYQSTDSQNVHLHKLMQRALYFTDICTSCGSVAT